MSDVYRNVMIFSANLTVRKRQVKSLKSQLIQDTCSIYVKIKRKIKTNPLPLWLLTLFSNVSGTETVFVLAFLLQPSCSLWGWSHELQSFAGFTGLLQTSDSSLLVNIPTTLLGTQQETCNLPDFKSKFLNIKKSCHRKQIS